ncbi:MAG: type II toxin-antitoxin system RelE/ParE family toxin [Trichloromonas sp.]|jgi:mRNA interferase RelE/StbE|nr:type II toxin-antitoxin system RelE/ParE family toxin [Trichloromonas sp.]
MTYELEFKVSALKEWRKLDESVRHQFKKKLIERLVHPKVEADRLRHLPDCYKIKLRNAGYRLVYQVDDRKILVIVVAVGRRDRLTVYRTAEDRT